MTGPAEKTTESHAGAARNADPTADQTADPMAETPRGDHHATGNDQMSVAMHRGAVAPTDRDPHATAGRELLPERGGRARGPVASTVHRNAALATLRPEQLPVAEQLLRGGIPALRRAIDEQNTRARTEGRAEVDPEQLLAMADELLPKMNLAAWKDRAVAARTADRDCPLRELRAVVAAASTVNLDDEARELQTALRKTLDTRVTALRESWLERMGRALDEQRVVDALQIASRSPDPSMRLPAELAVRLSDAAGSALRADLDDDTWVRTLEAVVASPVKRTVKPEGIPTGAGEQLLTTARSAAGSVPQLARLLGLPIPPPPGPRRPPRQLGPARRGAPA